MASENKKTATKKGVKETKKSLSSGKPMIRIVVRAFDHRIVDEATKTIIDTAERSGAIIAGPIPMPTKIEKFTVNRSTFKHKAARDQFEMRTHKRLIDIKESTPNTVTSLQSLTLPSGVDVEIKMA
jgi:small subunit ribosomal protein S10